MLCSISTQTKETEEKYFELKNRILTTKPFSIYFQGLIDFFQNSNGILKSFSFSVIKDIIIISCGYF